MWENNKCNVEEVPDLHFKDCYINIIIFKHSQEETEEWWEKETFTYANNIRSVSSFFVCDYNIGSPSPLPPN